MLEEVGNEVDGGLFARWLCLRLQGCEMVAHTHTLPPDQLVDLVRTLADQLVAARATQGDAFDPQPYLAQAAPLFAALYGVNRNTLLDTKECKARTQDARLEMDAAHLRLQVRSSSLAGCSRIQADPDAL